MRSTAGARPRNDLGHAIAGHIPDGDEHPSRERRVVREEARHFRQPATQAERPHVRSAAGAGPRDDLGPAVAGHVPDGDPDAPRERRVVREEARHLRRDATRQAERPHVRPAAGARPRDDVGESVAVDVPARHGHAPAKSGVVRIEARELGPGREAEHPHVWSTARAGTRDDLLAAVAVHVTAAAQGQRVGVGGGVVGRGSGR